MGGPDYAEIAVDGGNSNTRWEIFNWLRCPVMITNRREEVVWWGYIARAEMALGSVGLSVSLDSMYNRIAVAYSYVEAGSASVGERRTTAWTQDDDSVNEYGQKELLASVDGATTSQADSVRDALLSQRKLPQAVPRPAQEGQQIRLTCRGWWTTLAWRYYSNSNTTSVETTTQISSMISSAGEFINSTDIVDASGINSSEYRRGDGTLLDEVVELLRTPNGSGDLLTATITTDRDLRIEAEASSSASTDWLLEPNGQFRTPLGVRPSPGGSVLGWSRFHGVMPAAANLSWLAAPSPFFIEECEFEAATGKYNWRARGTPSPWEMTRILNQ